MLLKPLTTCDCGRCAWSSSELVVEPSSSASIRPSRSGVVVHRVDDDLARELVDGDVAVGLERDRHDDEVTGCGRLLRRRGPGVRPQLGDEVREGLGTPAVAEHDVVSGRDREPGDGAADVAAADETPGGHACSTVGVAAPFRRPDDPTDDPASGVVITPPDAEPSAGPRRVTGPVTLVDRVCRPLRLRLRRGQGVVAARVVAVGWSRCGRSTAVRGAGWSGRRSVKRAPPRPRARPRRSRRGSWASRPTMARPSPVPTGRMPR